MSKKVWIHECGGNIGNMTTQISISEPVDFALVVGNKSYRMQADIEGNLFVSLINGVDAQFTTRCGYATIRLTQSGKLSEDFYTCLKETYGS